MFTAMLTGIGCLWVRLHQHQLSTITDKNFMTAMFRSFPRQRTFALALAGLACSVPALAHAAAEAAGKPPSLIITSDPLPESLQKLIYSKPAQSRTIEPSDIAGRTYFQPTQTAVGAKVGELTGSLRTIQDKISGLSASLAGLERANEELAAKYYSNVATINTQLQSGTTPGNPRLVGRLGEAEGQLENLGSTISQFNGLAVDTSNTASEASFLLEQTRAAYSLSGAVEEDHVALEQLEDSISSTLVVIERVLNTVNDDITRTTTYMGSERNNLRTLALGVTNGDLYGKSLANRPFSSAPETGAQPVSFSPDATGAPAVSPAVQQTPQAAAQPLSGARPLVKIKFDQADVDYEQPVYIAVNEALQKYPDAHFDLVAVHPTKGNAAEVAIESTKARRNAEKVLRTLTQMGMPMDRVDLSYSADAAVTANEVRVYIKP
jgi:hypothetical protein